MYRSIYYVHLWRTDHAISFYMDGFHLNDHKSYHKEDLLKAIESYRCFIKRAFITEGRAVTLDRS